MSYTVYQHINKQNGKRYIGITYRKPEERWGIDGRHYSSSPHFWAAINKYGWDSFQHEIIATGLTKEAACQMEIDLIAKYDTQNTGYNMAPGGADGKIGEEARKKLSKAMLGNKNGLGHHKTPEVIAKIKAALTGRPVPEERRRKISIANTGKKYGPCSEETKKKISAAHKKKAVICTDTGEVYESIQCCAKETGFAATNICKSCKYEPHYPIHGLHFRYLDDVITDNEKPNDHPEEGVGSSDPKWQTPQDVGEDLV